MSLRRLFCVAGAAVVVSFAAVASALAVTVKEVDRVDDWPILAANPCRLEVVSGAGKLHYNFKVTLDDSGNIVDARLHLHAHDAKAAGYFPLAGTALEDLVPGAPTGSTYVVKEQFQTSEKVNLANTRVAVRGRLTLRFNRRGEDGVYILGDDFYARVQALAYVDNSGNLVVVKESESFDCK